MQIEVTSDLVGIRKLLRKLEPRERRAALKNVGEAGVGLVRDAFQATTDPYGTKWKPLADSTLASFVGAAGVAGRRRRRAYGSRPLNRTGVLLGSINSQLLSDDEVSIGTPFPWAKYHQGDPSHASRGVIPRRMFLPSSERGLPDAWRTEILDAVESYLEVRDA